MAADMNQLLAEWYKTPGFDKTASAPAPAEQEKLALAAQGQLFLKYAADRGADINALLKAGQNTVVDQLWNEFGAHQAKTAAAQAEFNKIKGAEFPPPKDDKKDGDKDDKGDKGKKDLEDKAKKEHEEKQAELKKIAMADFEGRVMAHSMVQELQLIQAGSPEVNKEAAAVVAAITKNATALQPGQAGADKTASSALATHSSIRSAAHHAGEFLKRHAPGAAAGAAVGAATHHAMSGRGGEEKKEASAIDLLAVEVAVDKIASFAFDDAKSKQATDDQARAFAIEVATDAAQKIAAADTLGRYSQPSVKVASAANWEAAVELRSLELLEGAGYPIQWA